MRWLDRKIIPKREYYILKWISRYQNTKKILKGKIDMNIQCILNAKHVVRFPYDGSFTLHPEQIERMKRDIDKFLIDQHIQKKYRTTQRDERKKMIANTIRLYFSFEFLFSLFLYVKKVLSLNYTPTQNPSLFFTYIKKKKWFVYFV